MMTNVIDRLNDAVENTQVFCLRQWHRIADAVAPIPAEREAVQLGMERLDKARSQYRAVDTALKIEAKHLAITHVAQRQLLREKQSAETAELVERHASTRSQEHANLRQVRASVLTSLWAGELPRAEAKAQVIETQVLPPQVATAGA